MKTCPLSYLFVLTPLFVAATGCSILKPRADLTRFYVLRAQPAGNDTKALPGPALAELRVGPGRIPAYLENTKIAVDAGANRVQYLDPHRWAEPLNKGLNRVLSENLASRLKIQQLTIYPDPALEASAYEVRYTVERFEGELTGTVTLVASWQVVEHSSGKRIAGSRSVYEVAAESQNHDVNAYVERLSKAVGQWADEVAAAVSSQ